MSAKAARPATDGTRDDPNGARTATGETLETPVAVHSPLVAELLAAITRRWGAAADARVLVYSGDGGVASQLAAVCRQVATVGERPARDGASPESLSAGGPAQRSVPPSHMLRIARPAAYAAAFDVVICLEPAHLEDKTALAEMARLAKPGGLLLVTRTVDGEQRAPGDDPADDLATALAGEGCRAGDTTDTLERGMCVFVKGPAVTVVVPVYNAHAHTAALIESIRRAHPGYPVRYRFVDDASPDPRIAPLLDTFAAEDPQSRQAEHQAGNVGFVQTCNAGMQAAGSDDVILLNSDTIVYDGWVRKLVEAAYSSPDVATVTPLSNNGSAYSVLKGVQAENEVNELLRTGQRALIDVPTGVGFCLYMKREAIERVGLFDPVFGRGYGEETDWCQRARALGYRHVLSPNVFIYHAGSASMVAAGVIEAGNETLVEHAKTLRERYPHFEQRVDQFLADGICTRLSADIAQRYITMQSARRPSLVFVIHTNLFADAVGGTQFHLRDMTRELGREHVFYAIYPVQGGLAVVGACDGVTARVRWASDDYDALLADLNPAVVHVHHLRGFSAAFADALARWSGPKLFTVHDFNGLCPSHTLLNDRDRYCGVPEQAECDRCAQALFEAGASAVAQRRAMHQRLIDSAELVIAPSASALEIFRRGISVPAERTRVLPHAVVPGTYAGNANDMDGADERDADEQAIHDPTGSQPTDGAHKPLAVGFIGYNGSHKGGTLIPGIVSGCRAANVRFVAVGEVGAAAEAAGKLVSTGPYKREEVVRLIRRAGIDVMVIASPWPETYNFTLTECWLAGVPAIVGPLGAPAERVHESGAGIVLPDLRVETFVDTLLRLANDRAERARLQSAAVAAGQGLPRDYQAYREMYRELGGDEPRPTQMFSGAASQQGLVQEELLVTPLPPIITKLVQMRKLIVPTGSRREQLYFRLHNLLTPVYAGGRIR